MLALALLVMACLGLSHWLVEPLVSLLQPVLSLVWIGWGLLGLLVWLLAGSGSERDPGQSQR
jgi:hypothetical protein